MGNQINQGSMSLGHKSSPGAPFPANAAENGLSVDPVTGRIVLGNDVGGITAILLNNRVIPMGGFDFSFTNGVGRKFEINNTADAISFGDPDFTTTGYNATLNMAGQLFTVGGAGQNLLLDNTLFTYQIGDIGNFNNGNNFLISDSTDEIQAFSNNGTVMDLDSLNRMFQIGAIGWGNNTVVSADDANNLITLAATQGIRTSDPGFLTGRAPWAFGDIVVAASVLDATQYLEVWVNGTVPGFYKLALIT